ncbi:MAG: NfeD family protein [Clostridiales bacterium]|nr:NfeD family protein [Clostridiales bacterium]
MDNIMPVFWIILTVVLVVIEAATVQLVTIWFAAGSVAALVSELLHAPIWLQWVIFFGVSVLTLLLTRPFVKKMTAKKIQPTNADRCIGQTATVLEEINNVAATGLVSVGGVNWTARSLNGEIIKPGEEVTVKKIEGVKVIVE